MSQQHLDLDVAPLAPASPDAPRWEDDPTGYALSVLTAYPQLYPAFERLADGYLARDPGGYLSADMVFHVLRYQGVLRHVRLNNNLTSLFARLYGARRPKARLRRRKSGFDAVPLAPFLALIPEDTA